MPFGVREPDELELVDAAADEEAAAAAEVLLAAAVYDFIMRRGSHRTSIDLRLTRNSNLLPQELSCKRSSRWC